MSDADNKRLAETSWQYVSPKPWAELTPAEQQEHVHTVAAVMAVATQPPVAPQLPFDGRPVLDQVGSVVSLARTVLTDIRGKQDYLIPVPRLELLLETLIALSDPPASAGFRDSAGQTVAGFMASIRSANGRVSEGR